MINDDNFIHQDTLATMGSVKREMSGIDNDVEVLQKIHLTTKNP